MRKNLSYLIGKKFNHLTILKFDTPGLHGRTRFLCQCDCGNMTTVQWNNIQSNSIKSCGCYHIQRSTVHGKCGTQVYRCWRNMKERCLNPNNTEYVNYGGRGITIYEPWIHSFEKWYSYVGEPPTAKHTLNRIDNNKGYEPGNVQWATQKEQANNKSTNHLIEFHGTTKTFMQWSEKLSISRLTLSSRLRRGWSVQKAFTTPIKKSQPHNADVISYP
jgi:hypothetical protein